MEICVKKAGDQLHKHSEQNAVIKKLKCIENVESFEWKP